MPEISVTDLRTTIAYLSDAAKLYDALSMQQSIARRAWALRRLVSKLQSKLPPSNVPKIKKT